MKYSDDCKVYRIRYYNVWFYLFAKTEMDEYKINILGERIGMGDSMMMKDIHCWCTRQNIRYYQPSGTENLGRSGKPGGSGCTSDLSHPVQIIPAYQFLKGLFPKLQGFFRQGNRCD